HSLRVAYEPGESTSGLFGGNSNWRGPIWFPVNYLLIESLQKFHHYYGDDFKIECPTGSGRFRTINEVANELTRRLTRIFLRDETGRRPLLAYHKKLENDLHFRDYVLFHEYFHGTRAVGSGHPTRPGGLASWRNSYSLAKSRWSTPLARVPGPQRLHVLTLSKQSVGQPRRTRMETTRQVQSLPEVVMPSCAVRQVLKGQKALITGANSGIGQGIAIALAHA